MAVQRDNPYLNFNFTVDIGVGDELGFSEVEGLSGEIEVIEYREGADRVNTARKLPGLATYPNVVLKRGITGRTDLFEWWKSVRDGQVQRRNVTITLLDEQRQPVLRWLLRNAFPGEDRRPRAQRVRQRGRDRNARARTRGPRDRLARLRLGCGLRCRLRGRLLCATRVDQVADLAHRDRSRARSRCPLRMSASTWSDRSMALAFSACRAPHPYRFADLGGQARLLRRRRPQRCPGHRLQRVSRGRSTIRSRSQRSFGRAPSASRRGRRRDVRLSRRRLHQVERRDEASRYATRRGAPPDADLRDPRPARAWLRARTGRAGSAVPRRARPHGGVARLRPRCHRPAAVAEKPARRRSSGCAPGAHGGLRRGGHPPVERLDLRREAASPKTLRATAYARAMSSAPAPSRR